MTEPPIPRKTRVWISATFTTCYETPNESVLVVNVGSGHPDRMMTFYTSRHSGSLPFAELLKPVGRNIVEPCPLFEESHAIRDAGFRFIERIIAVLEHPLAGAPTEFRLLGAGRKHTPALLRAEP